MKTLLSNYSGEENGESSIQAGIWQKVKNVFTTENEEEPDDLFPFGPSALNLKPEIEIFVPSLSHEGINTASTISYLQSDTYLNHPSTICIIASPRGVEILEECLDSVVDDSVKKRILDKVGYAVSPATASQLLKLGFVNIKGGDNAGNGDKLADLIINDLKQDNENDRLCVFFTGEVHRDIIPRKLTSAGLKVDKRVIYTTAVRKDIVTTFDQFITTNQINDDWIIFFSPQGTEYIIDYVKLHQTQFKIGVIGPTTETYLIDHDIIPTIVAPKPDAISLFVSSI
ncbi:tetrapyrrole biosynthesis, uroporphyrinogen III synthase [Scheffersomyces coipomensis]|uniref:tetrapyrrole biosynthesis, uroporphyrinogen III synthase n=1 Tax=Scheffersomyces coipomensis TaxID=1788519 RepID=UPI00315DFBCE